MVDPNSKQTNSNQSFIQSVRNHPIVRIFIVIAVVIAGIATFLASVSTIIGMPLLNFDGKTSHASPSTVLSSTPISSSQTETATEFPTQLPTSTPSSKTASSTLNLTATMPDPQVLVAEWFLTLTITNNSTINGNASLIGSNDVKFLVTGSSDSNQESLSLSETDGSYQIGSCSGTTIMLVLKPTPQTGVFNGTFASCTNIGTLTFSPS